MRLTRFTPLQHSILAVALAGAVPLSAPAQEVPANAPAAQAQALTPAQGALLDVVREATQSFKDVSVAEAAGYALQFGCVTGPDAGAMGLHFVNMNLVGATSSGASPLDARHPQIVIYEPTPSGRLQLIGADFLVLADEWNTAHNGAPPELMGQLFHYFETPNRFGLPAFYTLHVWAWKANPNGAFVNWHPNVSCASFAGQAP